MNTAEREKIRKEAIEKAKSQKKAAEAKKAAERKV
jgi:hypothetical protein